MNLQQGWTEGTGEHPELYLFHRREQDDTDCDTCDLRHRTDREVSDLFTKRRRVLFGTQENVIEAVRCYIWQADILREEYEALQVNYPETG